MQSLVVPPRDVERIADDLRGIIEGDVRFDSVTRVLYSTDASIFRLQPLGVVYPQHEGDVIQVLRYAAENRIPVLPRGAGTGLAGESLGAGIVLDFCRYMHRVVRVDDDAVVVQPGVPYQTVHRMLKPLGRRLAVDPASGAACTLGGMVATNASGSRSLRYGYTRDYVDRLRCILADGTLWDVGVVRSDGYRARSGDRTPEAAAVLLRDIVRRYGGQIRRLQAERQAPNRCGYLLHDVVQGDRVALARFLCGTEGTLAVVTGVRLRTIPQAPARAVALLFFATLDHALEAVQEIVTYGPTACDLLDRRLLHLVRAADGRYERIIPPAAEVALLVEHEADDAVEVYNRMRLTVNRVRRVRRLAIHAHEAYREEETRWVWAIRTLAAQQLARVGGQARPIPYLEDLGVPLRTLREFLSTTLTLLRRRNLVATLYAHVGQGKVHVRPFLDISDPAQFRLLEEIADELYSVVLEMGGSVSSEHGVGIARSPYVRRQYGELVEAFREIKRAFDPDGLLNPHKIVEPMSISVASLRFSSLERRVERPRLPLEVLEDEVRKCNGCALCRTLEPGFRMCPLFRADATEHASPRAKASLLRAVLQGELPEEAVFSSEFKQVVDLCVNCRMCARECPAGVDIPRLMLETRAAYVESNGLTVPEWFFSRIERWITWALPVAPAANWLLQRPWFRWVLERTVGVSRLRRLPSIASQSFLRWVKRDRRDQRDGPAGVVYFVDLYANAFDPSIAWCTVALLEASGVSVRVPVDQLPSGMPYLHFGDVPGARRVAQHNVRVLAEWVREGWEVVCSEPTAVVMLRDEYPRLLENPEASLVAQHVWELGDYLRCRWSKAGGPRLVELPRCVAYHAPCHLLALERGRPFLELLERIPGLIVRDLHAGCSGMAGPFGLMAANVQTSWKAGEQFARALRSRPFDYVVSECCTCRLQAAHFTGVPVLHPVQLLVQAVPAARRRLPRQAKEADGYHSTMEDA